ncbi:MAG: hypothetical protein J4G15_07825 [Alphaproteobacteria bacterium]|nr:hypothetical protein [Alphaproteobacteria bacterium]MCY4608168.1 hypothetical protein [bacterium]
MKRALPFLAVLIAMSPALAGSVTGVLSATSVRIEAYVNQGRTLAIALLPPPEVTLSGTLGVAFAPAEDGRPWTGELPRVVRVDADYFDGPVLETFPFDRGRLHQPAAIAVTFGACIGEARICVLEEALITISPATEGHVDVAIALIGP